MTWFSRVYETIDNAPRESAGLVYTRANDGMRLNRG